MKAFIEENIIEFVGLLRKTGIKVSSGEIIVALNSLALIDVLNQKQFKEALRANFIKNQDEQEIFEKSFQAFFVPPEIRHQQSEEWEKQKEEEARLRTQADQDLVYQGIQLQFDDDDKLLYSLLPEEQKKKIKDFLEASYLPEDRLSTFKPTLETMVRGSLHYWQQHLQENEDPPDLIQVDGELLANINKELYEEDSLLYKDIKKIGEEDFFKATNLLKKLSRKLATKISRRYRISKKRDKIDLRHSIKSNVRYDGIILNIKYKQKRVQKPSLLLVCDVSGSMSRYTAFILQFIYGLRMATKNLESFIFAEDLEYFTPYFRRTNSFQEIMKTFFEKTEHCGKGTDIGASLQTLRKCYRQFLTPNTVIIIVSDTQTLKLETAEYEVGKLKKSIKDIIWLNTLPFKAWKEHKSVQVLKKHCKMFECFTLAHLERIIRNQFLH